MNSNLNASNGNAQPNSGQNARPGVSAAHALRAALSNPYAAATRQSVQSFPSWSAATAGPSYVTAEGYTISSTYSHVPAQRQQVSRPIRGSAPGQRWTAQPHYQPSVPSVPRNTHVQNHRPSNVMQQNNGSLCCAHEGCTFMGSAKVVETHKMDRHLIFPPGWKKRKSDWDADPSLNNGKPVPIPGTGIILDTPEAIAAWIAERKKRWPTTQRVAEKKANLETAVARGDLLMTDPNQRSNKRQRIESSQDNIRSANHGRGRGRGRGSRGGRGARSIGSAHNVQHSMKREPPHSESSSSSDSESDSSDSNSDMDPIHDAVSSKQPIGDQALIPQLFEESRSPSPVECENRIGSNAKAPPAAKRPRQPRPPPRNPFAQRPSLLKNLLLPEIRATVSNLSQAIRFVVQNDFFDGVELKPGDAQHQLIRVIDEVSTDNTEY